MVSLDVTFQFAFLCISFATIWVRTDMIVLLGMNFHMCP